MRALVNNFFKGCLVLFPVVGTVYAIWFVLSSLDLLVQKVVPLEMPPGVGLLTAVAVITVSGAIASNVIGRTLVGWVESLMARLPIVRLVYGAIRDLLSALVGEKRSFERPAVVTLPGEVRVLGFITCDHFEDKELSGLVSVYLPQSYNFAGNMILVPKDRVQLLDRPGSDFLAFIVSGGIATSR